MVTRLGTLIERMKNPDDVFTFNYILPKVPEDETPNYLELWNFIKQNLAIGSYEELHFEPGDRLFYSSNIFTPNGVRITIRTQIDVKESEESEKYVLFVPDHETPFIEVYVPGTTAPAPYNHTGFFSFDCAFLTQSDNPHIRANLPLESLDWDEKTEPTHELKIWSPEHSNKIRLETKLLQLDPNGEYTNLIKQLFTPKEPITGLPSRIINLENPYTELPIILLNVLYSAEIQG